MNPYLCYAMKRIAVPHSETRHFSPIVLDYLIAKDKLKPFYQYPVSLDSFRIAIEDKKNVQINRKTLVETLQAQYQDTSINNIVESNISSLLHDNTFTVTTGHQLCLFMGPLYFIYKIINVINLAELLKETYPSTHFVPVFWMASEDHGMKEVDHINLFGKTIKWEPEQEGAIGSMKTDSLKPVLEELAGMLGEGDAAAELLQLFRDSYIKHPTLAEATRHLLNELFGEFGLVIIDGDDARLKNEFKEIIRKDIPEQVSFKLCRETCGKLSADYKTQAVPREIGFFYLKDNIRGRIVKKGNSYQVHNTGFSFTEKELLDEIDNHPERFSPDVMMRTLYQEKILPNLAYIGGPAEVGYWLQYKKVFEHYEINYPVLLLRNSVLWIESRIIAKLQMLRIEPEELFLEKNQLIALALSRLSSDEINLDEEKEGIKGIYENLAEKAAKADSTLKSAVESELQKQFNAIEKLEAKMLKAEKRKHQDALRQIENILNKLFPGNILQERHYNFIPYYLKYGRQFIHILKKELKPMEMKLTVLPED